MTKKITLIICYCLIGIIAAALIICAIVPKDYLPRMEDPDTLKVEYVGDSLKQATYDTNSPDHNAEDYNRLITSFRNSFKQSVLSALFAGELTTSQVGIVAGESTVNTSPDSGFKFTFYFDEPQSVYLNGREYNDPNFGGIVKTTEMFCYITNDVGFSGIYLNFKIENNNSSSTVNYVRITTISSTSSLHELCMDILNIEEESSEATA